MAKSSPLPFPTKYGLYTALALATGCGGGSHTQEVLPTEVDVRIERLDRDLFSSATDTAGNFHLRLFAEYGSFYQAYVERVLQVGPVSDPRIAIALTGFVLDPDWRRTQQHADSLLGDMAEQQADFNTAFGRLKSFFPDSLTPRIVTFNSGFNYGIVPTDSVLGIGVEWFTGRDNEVVRFLPTETFPQYMKDRMQPGMLVPSAVKGWLQTHYAPDTRGEDVLTNLVEMGKVMYLLSNLLPETNPAYTFAFSDEQLKWCEDSEFNIWKELIAKEQLYSKKPEDVDRLLNDGPFTNGFPRESPGHIGEWIGYRMVNAYTQEHPEITFADLFAKTDARAVLKSYKPR